MTLEPVIFVAVFCSGCFGPSAYCLLDHILAPAMIRGEALYSNRSAWYVCFPGIHGKDRLTNFKGPGRDKDELALAERTLSLFSALAEMGINDKAQLMIAGAAARTTMRSDESATDEEVQSAALAALGLEGGLSVDAGRSASREESPELEDCAGGTRTRRS